MRYLDLLIYRAYRRLTVHKRLRPLPGGATRVPGSIRRQGLYRLSARRVAIAVAIVAAVSMLIFFGGQVIWGGEPIQAPQPAPVSEEP